MTVTYNLHSGLTGWTGPFGYVVGNRVVNAGNAYQCIIAGTSASGAGPTATTSNITDGTVHWKWLSAVDFTSLSAAATALPATFTQPIIWLLWNDGTISIPGANTPYLTLTGHTTTSTNNLTITCAPGESIRDSLHTGQVALAFNAAAGVSITLPTTAPGFHVDYIAVFDANVVIDGLQFKDPNAVTAPIGCSILAVNPSATNFVMRNCIIDCIAQANMTQLGFYGTPYTVANCLFVDRQPVAGGQSTIKAEALGTFVNNTHIGINSPAGTFAILSNYTGGSNPFSAGFAAGFGSGSSPSPIIVRNTACFGYTGIGVAVVATGAIAIDHSATSGSSVGSNVTDSGGNLVSQSAATTFISTTADFRLTLGASSGNAAATDTIDIPAADDIARTPRTIWDIGAFELVSLQMRAGAIAQGRAGLRVSVPARGIAQADATAILTVLVAVTSLGSATARGTAVGSFNLVGSSGAWSSGFSAGFGPLGTSAIVSAGRSATTGRAAVTIALPLAAKGIAQSSGRPPTLFVASALVTRARTKANATAAITAILSINARAQSAGRGRSAIAGVAALAAAARSATAGKSVTQYIAGLSTRGKAIARASFSNAILGYRSLGRAAASGLSLAVYRAPPTRVNRAASATFGRATLTSNALLGASGSSASSGVSLFGDENMVLSARGGANASGQITNVSLDAFLPAQSVANAAGRGLVGVVLPMSAAAHAADTGRGNASYTAFLTSRGSASGRGRFTPATLSTALLSVGVSKAKGKGGGQYNALLRTLGTAFGSSTPMFSIALPLSGRGVAALAGQIGSLASQRLSALGVATTRGLASVQAKALLVLRGYGATLGSVSSLILAKNLVAIGTATASAPSSFTASRFLLALGTSRARSKIAPNFTVALSAIGRASGAAKSITISRQALLTAKGISGAIGQIVEPESNAPLTAIGTAKGSAATGGVIFAPVALVAKGNASGFSKALLDPKLPISGLGIGLSEGRCRTIATVLLQASGRSRAQGILSAAVAVGFIARGQANARGILYSTQVAQARGRAAASGTALIAGLYNVTPDTQSPTLSTLTSLPAFDSMDIGDTDFFSFDWSSRMSAIRDPIVSASVVSVPPGLSIGPVVFSGNIVQVRCGSTTTVETFSLRCSITLRSGRTLHWSAPVSVEDF